IADKVVELTPNEAVIYLGDYDYYVEKKTETEEIEAFEREPEAIEKTATERKVNFKEQKRIQSETRRLEREISEIETTLDRKSTRLNSSHVSISYAVFCLNKKKQKNKEKKRIK